MNLFVVWGRGNRRPVADVESLAAALDEVTTQAAGPQAVGLYPPEYLAPDFMPWESPELPAMQLGIGHPDRAFVLWLGPGDGVGYQRDLPPWPDGVKEIEFDYGGDPVFCGPDRACVTPATARQAAQEFVTSGTRPMNVLWRANEPNLS